MIAEVFWGKQRLRQRFEREEKHYCGMRYFPHSEEAGEQNKGVDEDSVYRQRFLDGLPNPSRLRLTRTAEQA